MQGSFIDKMNDFGSKRRAFLFIIDYEMNRPLIIPFEDAVNNNILISIRGTVNYQEPKQTKEKYYLKKYPVDYSLYKASFDKVLNSIRYGNSFLSNLTFPTEIETNLTLEQIFCLSKAPYKLLVRNEFVVFSPEPFVRIRDRKISSFPMKGTLDASIADAKNILLNDPKELAEHHTIVDLIRNDLSIVAEQVTVSKFRYIDEVVSKDKKLLQVSSEISGVLPENYHENVGNIIADLLPAGSICGAPKKKTLEIIREAETGPRGYYTGIFGIFDGSDLDSAVMIRYVENVNGRMIYRSGGGITISSDPIKEFQELIDKVYLPID